MQHLRTLLSRQTIGTPLRARLLAGDSVVKTIFAGLVIVQADPYLYPLLTAGIIFGAVLVDTVRRRMREHLTRRLTRIEPAR